MSKKKGDIKQRDEKGKFIDKNTIQMLRRNYKGGRPRHYDTPEQFFDKVMEYFEWADEVHKGKYSYADLKLYTGLIKRQTFHDYIHNPLFSDIFFIIDLIMEGDSEKRLNWVGSFQGAKFKLMNKHGWKEEQDYNLKLETIKTKWAENGD